MRYVRPLAAMIALSLVLSGCGDEPEPEPEAPAAPAATSAPTIASRPPAPATNLSQSTDGAEWLIMIYSDADDEVLERDIFTDLNEAELVGSTEQVAIVSQIDRYEGGFDGDGDWTDTRRYYVTQDGDLQTLNSELVEELGEANMADPQTLVDFVNWAITNYPAQRYALILSDHGMGWPGGWSDPDPADVEASNPIEEAFGNTLLLNELEGALGEILQQNNLPQLDLIGFDACLMAHIEVAAAMAPYATTMVASQEVEPALGWAYAAFLEPLTQNPTMDSTELGQTIVKAYIDSDMSLVDDDLRASIYGDSSAEEVISQVGANVTLGAYNLPAMGDLMGALNELSQALPDDEQGRIAEVRTYAQGFETVFESDAPSAYIDLGHFAEILREETNSDTIRAAADNLLNVLGNVVISERNGPDRPGASGLSIYFPASDVYGNTEGGGSAETYTSVAGSFAAGSLWDNFLNFHYYGSEITDDTVGGETITAPGASELSVADLELSASEINQADKVVVSTSVDGGQIGFIYTFTGYYNPEEDTILIADRDYIDAGESSNVGGVFYPNWGDERPIEIEYEWEPIIYGINNGEEVTFALFAPEDYGDTDDAATYSVEGRYQFKDGTERRAKLFFKDDKLIKTVTFTNNGAPREITPREGDSFTVVHQYIALNSDNPDAEVEYFEQDGDSFTFGKQRLTLETLTAPAGDYVLGILAEDFDGNLFEAYNTVTVNE